MLYADTHIQQWDEPNLFSKTILSPFLMLKDSSTVTCLYPCKKLKPCNTLWINMESVFLNPGKVPHIHI